MARSGHQNSRVMGREPLWLDGQRIAFATIAEGRLLLFGGRWVTHLEGGRPARSCVLRGSRAPAPRRALRRIGAGLSDRPCSGFHRRLGAPDAGCGARPSGGAGDDLRVLVRRACDGRVCEHVPGRVQRAVFFGGYVSRTTSPRRRAARSWTSCARTGSSRPRCSRVCSCLAAAERKSKHRAGTSGIRPMPTWLRPSSSSTGVGCATLPADRDRPGARAAPAR